MKPGDRVVMKTRYSTLGQNEPALLLVVPTMKSAGLIAFDRAVGHNCDIGTIYPDCDDFILVLKKDSRGDLDEELIRQHAPPNATHLLWWVYPEEIEVITKRAPTSVQIDLDEPVPGRHHCAGGCGDINTYATMRCFVDGKYLCYSCRNIWNPRPV